MALLPRNWGAQAVQVGSNPNYLINAAAADSLGLGRIVLNDRSSAIAVVQEARICLLAGAAIKDSADPTDALLVLLSGPLSLLHGCLFDPNDLCAKVRDQYGWSISPQAVEYFIPKLRSMGWLQSRGTFPSRGPFYVNLPEPDVEGEGFDTTTALLDLGDAFLAFSRSISPINALPAEPAEAGAILLRYVVDASAPLVDTDQSKRSEEQYLCARFAEHVTRKKLPLRETLSRLSALGFLFRVAEEIGHPTHSRQIDLRVIVDAPVILDFLGTGGPIRASAVREPFESLRKIGAVMVTFAHCVDEAREALRMVLKAAPLDRFGPTGEALRKGWVNQSVLQNLLQAFDVAVRREKIEILPDDIHFMPQSHQYFDQTKAKQIEESVNWHGGDNETAIYRDADTTTLTIRRRAGHRTSDAFTSKYICVTTNDAFAGTTSRTLREMNYYNSRQIPPIITLKELSAKVWIEVGNKDASDRFAIPRSQMLLSCDRALRFNRNVVEKAKAELAKVKPEQLPQFELLLEIPRSARAIMDATLSDEKYVSGDTIEQLVEAAVDAAGREASSKERELRLRERTKLNAKLAEVETQLESVKSLSEDHIQALESIRSDKAKKDSDMIEALVEKALSRFALWRTFVISAALFVALVPLAVTIFSYMTGLISIYYVAFSAVAAFLTMAAAMDRPGAWLSKLMYARLEKGITKTLREVARDDLAEHLTVRWHNGTASWSCDVAAY